MLLLMLSTFKSTEGTGNRVSIYALGIFPSLRQVGPSGSGVLLSHSLTAQTISRYFRRGNQRLGGDHKTASVTEILAELASLTIPVPTTTP